MKMGFDKVLGRCPRLEMKTRPLALDRALVRLPNDIAWLFRASAAWPCAYFPAPAGHHDLDSEFWLRLVGTPRCGVRELVVAP